MLSLPISIFCFKSRNVSFFQNDIMIPSSSLIRVSNNPRAYLLLLLKISIFLLRKYCFWNNLKKIICYNVFFMSKHIPLISSHIFITFILYLINLLSEFSLSSLKKAFIGDKRRHLSFRLGVCNFLVVLLKHLKMCFQISIKMV